MLEKYHKQKHSPDFIKPFKEINKKYQLNYNLKDDFDLLKLSIFQTSLNQKKFFEAQFEAIRNECFDMWDYLSFYERNDIILKEGTPRFNTLHSFEFEQTRIFIPIFDRLLNSLYTTETAILELPQYFELYRDFKDRLIDIETYQLAPYKAGFTYCKVVRENENSVVLYDSKLNVFYKLGETNKRYPIYFESKPTETQILEIAEFIIEDNFWMMDYLSKNNLLSKKCNKKYKKFKLKEAYGK